MQTYLNRKTAAGRETVDEVRREDFGDAKAYRKEVGRLCREYAASGYPVYPSSRACANWGRA